MDKNSNAIYLNAGFSNDRKPPYIVVGVSIREDCIDGVNKVFDTLLISKRLHKIKKLPVKHFLQIIEVVRLINERSYPKAIQAYLQKITYWDIYLKGESVASIKAIKSISRCLYGSPIYLRTSYNIGKLNLPSLIYERGQDQLSSAMLIALSLSKCIRQEYHE